MVDESASANRHSELGLPQGQLIDGRVAYDVHG